MIKNGEKNNNLDFYRKFVLKEFPIIYDDNEHYQNKNFVKNMSDINEMIIKFYEIRFIGEVFIECEEITNNIKKEKKDKIDKINAAKALVQILACQKTQKDCVFNNNDITILIFCRVFDCDIKDFDNQMKSLLCYD